MKIKTILIAFLIVALAPIETVFAQTAKKQPPAKGKPAAKAPAKPPAKKKPKTKFFGQKPIPFINTALTLAGPTSKIGRDGIQCDLPTAVADKDGHALIAYLEWDGEIDRLILRRETEKGLQQISEQLLKVQRQRILIIY